MKCKVQAVLLEIIQTFALSIYPCYFLNHVILSIMVCVKWHVAICNRSTPRVNISNVHKPVVRLSSDSNFRIDLPIKD
jgi:hypothetical protein